MRGVIVVVLAVSVFRRKCFVFEFSWLMVWDVGGQCGVLLWRWWNFLGGVRSWKLVLCYGRGSSLPGLGTGGLLFW